VNLQLKVVEILDSRILPRVAFDPCFEEKEHSIRYTTLCVAKSGNKKIRQGSDLHMIIHCQGVSRGWKTYW
jgi:hypothetical protein